MKTFQDKITVATGDNRGVYYASERELHTIELIWS